MKSKSIAKTAIRILRSWQRLFLPSLINNDGRININAKKRIRSILITRFHLVGDMILFIPILRELRKLFPKAKIDLLAFEPSGIETIRECPYIDQILIYWGGKGFIKKWFGRLKTRMIGYDIFITSCAETNLAREGFYFGAKYMIGFKEKARFGVIYKEEEPYLLDISLDYDPNIHEVDQNLKIVQALGADKPDNTLEYYITEKDSLYIKDLLLNEFHLSGAGPLIVIHAGSKQPQKRWIPERFAEVGKRLVEHFGACVIFIGVEQEANLIGEIIKKMGGRGLDLSGRTTLGQLSALLKQIDILICNDSGPMHLAAVVGAPSVILWGPGEYANWRPIGDPEKVRIIRHKVPCSPCHKLDCEDNICMKLIAIDEIYEAVEKMLSNLGWKEVH